MTKHLLLSIAALLCAAQAWAGEATVTVAWVRATAPGQDSAAVSLHIRTEADARLVSASSPAAERVEIHIMKHENGMMTMRETESLALPAGQEVALESGSHLMLVGLKQPLKAGETVQLALTVQYADKRREVITVAAEVRALSASHDGQDMKDMHGKGHHGH
ncbi:MAG TPA: copper chaperone PCu(A)C [Gallionellaceae bacterium]